MPYAVAVILLALTQYIVFTARVGAARGKFGIDAPAISGHAEFERLFRVQQNTLEQLILFVPAAWAFAAYVDPYWSAGIGLVYIIGRFVYAGGYVSDPVKRGPGMLITMLSNVVLIIGAFIGCVIAIV